MNNDTETNEMKKSAADLAVYSDDGLKVIRFPMETDVEEYAVPEGIKVIGYNAFSGCASLKRITVPASVESIEPLAFSATEGLCEILVDPANEQYISLAGVLYNKKMTCLIACPAGSTKGRFEIPASVTEICDWAFAGCKDLEEVVLPEGLITVGNRAFSGCASLKEICLPGQVETIGEMAFWGCTKIGELTIPANVKAAGLGAFFGCENLETVTLSASMTAIPTKGFMRCTKLASIEIPEGITDIGEKAFSGDTALTALHLPASFCHLGKAAFENCEQLTDLYYAGSEEQFDHIALEDDNEVIFEMEIHIG